MLIIFIVLSYLSGSIPFGYLVAKAKKVDIREKGSGNIGATNISRSLGMKYAVIVGLLDFLKGVVPVFLVSMLTGNELVLSLVALATVLGNIFPIFLKFKGGKGVSTYSGTLLVLLDFRIFIIIAILWVAYIYISRLMSLVNITSSLIIPAIFFFLQGSGIYFLYSLIVACLIWYSHRENIKRLTSGTEKKLKF